MQESNDRAEARTSKWVPRTPGGNPSGRFENLRARWRDSVWQPVIIKSLSVCAGMVGLAAIGIFSTLDAPDPQDQLSSGDESSPIATIEEATWLAGMGLPAAKAASTAGMRTSNPVQEARRTDALHVSGSPDTTTSLVRTASESSAASALGDPVLDAPTHDEPGGGPSEESDDEPPAPGVTPDGKVILNTASVDELTRLPGVGQKRAQKIVELRTRIKRFRKPTDLLRVRGIGVKSLRKMLPHLVVDPPPPSEPAAAPKAPQPASPAGLDAARNQAR